MSKKQKDDLATMIDKVLSNSRHSDESLLMDNSEVSRKLVNYIETENLLREAEDYDIRHVWGE